jgi:3-phenylpropionate/trans-cinnamate dioxygenase ferredoxin reductase subunit
VHCADGERLACDLVVVGIGIVPNTELATAAGLAVEDGIRIDACARTSDPHVVAAGDCTRFDSALYGRSVRLESVPNALEQARSAAAALLELDRPFESAPWFWSDQYDLKLKMVGLSQGYEQLVLRGSPDAGSFCAFYLKGRRVLAVDTVNRVPDFMVAKRLVGERIEVEPGRLADEAIPLKSLLPAA